ncbi:Uncharacterized protein M6B38_110050 [Iris pallida]|uniref:Uncharacterized protein n=1 Tax=Iris pallida TaxID=29817 RepID=A0AAX6DZC4_IRIPA|nr:Uncharacterized protein M6B38_110050 [Iris pallida]
MPLSMETPPSSPTLRDGRDRLLPAEPERPPKTLFVSFAKIDLVDRPASPRRAPAMPSCRHAGIAGVATIGSPLCELRAAEQRPRPDHHVRPRSDFGQPPSAMMPAPCVGTPPPWGDHHADHRISRVHFAEHALAPHDGIQRARPGGRLRHPAVPPERRSRAPSLRAGAAPGPSCAELPFPSSVVL